MKVLYVYNKPYSTGIKCVDLVVAESICNEKNILSGHLYCVVKWISAFIGMLLLYSDPCVGGQQ